MENQLVIPQTSPDEMIGYAIEKGATVDQIEKLLAMKERFEANEARKAYHVAMAAFKADPPKIKKDKKVGFSGSGGARVGYAHASLGNVTEAINAGLSKHGLSASWSVSQNGTGISVTTKITHKLGHSEETTITAAPDTSGAKNSIQAIGSTVTYLERYGLLALTGLATYDIDDDGQAAVTTYIDEKELSQIIDMINDVEADQTKFCEYMKIESIAKMPKSQFNQAMAALKSKKVKK